MTYDGDGNRASKKVGGTTTYYLLDDRNPSGYVQVLEEWTVTSTATNLGRVYNYGLSLINQRVPNASTNYFISDGHGSTRALMDIGGNVVNTFAYDAYGTLIASNGLSQTAYLYCGQQFDSDLGQYYLRARIYNPGTGRLGIMDTYEGNNETPVSLHKYIYCQNDPINGFDPSGEIFTDKFGYMAHDLIGGRYLAGHPGTIINPLNGVFGSLKPDILNGPARLYAEIKPLSFPGITDGFIRIEVYDQVYGKLGFKRETQWPGGFGYFQVGEDPFVYFNVDGLIFYTDAVDFIDDLKKIKDESTAFKVMRQLVTKIPAKLYQYVKSVSGFVAKAEEADIEETEGIATTDSEMGAP